MKIINVWKTNLKNSIKIISNLIKKYNYVSMDSEFPGIVGKPNKLRKEVKEDQYQILKCNVDLLQIIQLGFAFADENGKISSSSGCLQFNFHFNIESEMFAQDSIDLLLKSGVNFHNHEKKGIDVKTFGRLLINSGLISNENIKWITFHSGYDFGYLVKILTNKFLPFEKKEFFSLLKLFFPCSYDMKYLGICMQNLHGGLNKLADKFNVLRIGPDHQAGSDSLLTLNVFFKLKKIYFNGFMEKKYQGVLFGLNSENSKKFSFQISKKHN
jgi:CCR4-NOT transcription complex subunit 7/8